MSKHKVPPAPQGSAGTHWRGSPQQRFDDAYLMLGQLCVCVELLLEHIDAGTEIRIDGVREILAEYKRKFEQ